jgi:hypothetical protein
VLGYRRQVSSVSIFTKVTTKHSTKVLPEVHVQLRCTVHVQLPLYFRTKVLSYESITKIDRILSKVRKYNVVHVYSTQRCTRVQYTYVYLRRYFRTTFTLTFVRKYVVVLCTKVLSYEGTFVRSYESRTRTVHVHVQYLKYLFLLLGLGAAPLPRRRVALKGFVVSNQRLRREGLDRARLIGGLDRDSGLKKSR